MVHGKEKKERAFPLAGDTDNDATYDHEEETEEAPSAGPPVASSAQIQTYVSSFFEPAPTSAADVARQLLRLTDEDILDFTSSRNTLHYQPIIAKLLCMQTSLAARFETICTDVAAAAASPRGPSQMLLSPLPSPQQMPASRHVHTDFRDIVGFKPFVLGVHDESTAHACAR